MPISKSELQTELKNFLFRFAGCLERIYSPHPAGGLLGFPTKHVGEMSHEDTGVEQTMLWKAINDMYDFGISGVMVAGRHLGDGELLDADFCDAEMFLRGLPPLEQYLEECEVEIPELSIQVVRAAVARHVLEGGERYTGFGEEVSAGWGLISIAEIALLADMDERSVRNAANPKLVNPLNTVVHGKRTYVEISEANRWLSERKGFTPTKINPPRDHAESHARKMTIELTADVASTLQAKANSKGISVEELLNQLLTQSAALQ